MDETVFEEVFGVQDDYAELVAAANKLYVEVFGSKEQFIELVMKELDKTDELKRELSMNKKNMKFTKNFAGQLGDEEVDDSTPNSEPARDKAKTVEENIAITFSLLDSIEEAF